MGFKGKALNISFFLSGGLCPPLNSFVINKLPNEQIKLAPIFSENIIKHIIKKKISIEKRSGFKRPERFCIL